jgi:hypothetical protein
VKGRRGRRVGWRRDRERRGVRTILEIVRRFGGDVSCLMSVGGVVGGGDDGDGGDDGVDDVDCDDDVDGDDVSNVVGD